MNNFGRRVMPMLLQATINVQGGGLQQSVYYRASALSRNGKKPLILCSALQLHSAAVIEKLRTLGRIDPNVEVRTLFNDLKNISRKLPAGTGTHHPIIAEGNQKYIKTLNEDQTVQKIDYFDNSGRVFITQHYENSKPTTIDFYDKDYSKIEFPSITELTEYWLINFYSDALRDNCLIVEWGYSLHTLLSHLKDKLNTKPIFQFHSNHMESANRLYGNIQRSIENILRSAESLGGAVIALTPQQKIDLLKKNPYLKQIEVISHVRNFPNDFVPDSRDPQKAIIVAAFRAGKNIDRMVKSFADVVARVPSAQLEIWGDGPEKEKIQAAIVDSKLQGNVKLMGRTEQPLKAYSRGSVALFASDFEGQPLSMAESIVAGCVPVTMDFKYGPRLMIRDAETGIIVRMNQYDEFADSIALLFIRDDIRESMAKNAKEYFATINSEEVFCRKWTDLFERLTS